MILRAYTRVLGKFTRVLREYTRLLGKFTRVLRAYSRVLGAIKNAAKDTLSQSPSRSFGCPELCLGNIKTSRWESW